MLIFTATSSLQGRRGGGGGCLTPPPNFPRNIFFQMAIFAKRLEKEKSRFGGGGGGMHSLSERGDQNEPQQEHLNISSLIRELLLAPLVLNRTKLNTTFNIYHIHALYHIILQSLFLTLSRNAPPNPAIVTNMLGI